MGAQSNAMKFEYCQKTQMKPRSPSAQLPSYNIASFITPSDHEVVKLVMPFELKIIKINTVLNQEIAKNTGLSINRKIEV